MLGAFGWNRLLTQPGGDYESGVFDLRSPSPRPTALAGMVSSFSKGKTFEHPLLKQKGWWQKESRFIHPPVGYEAVYDGFPATQPLLIIGKNGMLGRAFGLICQQRGIKFRILSRQEMDICDPKSIENILNIYRPWAIVNAAGYTRIDSAELEPQKCFNDNVLGVKNLADACKQNGIRLLTFSSAMVFDGTKSSPYLESDPVAPLNIYGKSKAEAENVVLQADCQALVIRTGWFFSPWKQPDFIHHILTDMNNNYAPVCPEDVVISPTYVPDLVQMALDLLIDEESGLWHLTNQGEFSWAALTNEVVQRRKQYPKHFAVGPGQLLNWQAPRPLYSALGSERGNFMPPFEQALDRYFSGIKV